MPNKHADWYAFATIRELARELRAGRVTSVEMVEIFLRRIERYNSDLLAFITVTADLAREQARRADAELRNGQDRGLLHGIPWGVKDLYDTKGIRTTWGSPIYRDRVPERTATAVARLEDAGAVLLGKLATGEFAGGIRDLMGDVHNPWKLDHSPLGSSAGPGAATAAGLVTFSLGTDTGGSIIAPSGANGVTGLVPTFGRVSRYGVMSLAWSLDKCGPICRSADDAGLVLHAIAGPDPKDVSCRNAPFACSTPPGRVRGMKLGVVRSAFDAAKAAGTKPIFDAALEKMRELGATLEDMELKPYPYAEIYSITNHSEAACGFQDMLKPEEIDKFANPERRDAWFAGLTIRSVDYIRAQRVRTEVIEYTKVLFGGYDALIAPNSVYPAPLIHPPKATNQKQGGRPHHTKDSDLDHLCYISGVTFLSTRCGFHEGLPLGLKFVAEPWAEHRVITLANAYEQATDWRREVPRFLP